MLRQLLRRGQITIPVKLLKQFRLKEKDYVQVNTTEKGILIQPVSVSDYTPAEIEALREKLNELPRGDKRIFSSARESRTHLNSLKKK